MEDIFREARQRRLSKGQILIYEGDPISNLFRIMEGYVKVYNIQSDGAARIIFIYSPNDMFPLTTFLSGVGIGRYFYECMTDVNLQIIPQARFQELLRGNLNAGEEFIHYTMDISQQFLERISALSSNSAHRKVVSLLHYLVERAGTELDAGASKLKIPLTSQDIADLCGLSRETVTIQLSKLKKSGVISGTRFLTIDTSKLKND